MITAKFHGLHGMCTESQTRKEFVKLIVKKLDEGGVSDPKDILLSFSNDHVFDGGGDSSSFCVIHVTPGHSTQDLVLLVSILKHETGLNDRIKLARLDPIPIVKNNAHKKNTHQMS
jgi:hypothetical protein